jgi:hypothetical protein
LWIDLAAAAAGGATKDPTAQQLINMGFAAWRNGYSRDNEDQADRVGLRYAYEGGFDVEKGSRVWIRMLERHGEPDKLYNLINGSHTRPSERYSHLQNEISLNYLPPPAQPSRQAGELAGDSGAKIAQPLPILAQPAPAAVTARPVERMPDALSLTTAAPSAAVAPPAAVAPSAPAVSVLRPLPPHVVRNAAGKLFPVSGYQWMNPEDPNDHRVRLMPGLINGADGKLRPASGYQWVNPTDPKDFRVKLIPGIIKTENDFRPDKGYRWINPKDPKDLRVEPIP